METLLFRWEALLFWWPLALDVIMLGFLVYLLNDDDFNNKDIDG